MTRPPEAPAPRDPQADAPDWSLLDRYLAGEASPDEAARVERWVAGSPERATLLDALRQRGLGGADADRWDVDDAWRRVAARTVAAEPTPIVRTLRPARRWSGEGGARRLAPWGIAAALLVAAGSLAVWRAESRRDVALRSGARAVAGAEHVVATPNGKRAVVRLPDGTRVVLDAGSRLAWDDGYGRGMREVRLAGEAYFEVAHDRSRPFRVRTAVAEVRDLGTRFGVRAYPETRETRVVVAEGRVSLRAVGATVAGPAADSAVLAANQLGRVAAGERPRTRSVDASAYLAWTEGELAFDDVPLREALPELARWYDVDIVLGDPSLGDRRLSARWRAETLPPVLDALSLALGVRAERRGRTVILLPAPATERRP